MVDQDGRCMVSRLGTVVSTGWSPAPPKPCRARRRPAREWFTGWRREPAGAGLLSAIVFEVVGEASTGLVETFPDFHGAGRDDGGGDDTGGALAPTALVTAPVRGGGAGADRGTGTGGTSGTGSTGAPAEVPARHPHRRRIHRFRAWRRSWP